MKRTRAGFVALAVFALASHGGTRAEMPGEVPDKLRFSLGGMLANAFTDAGYGSVSAGLGGTVNFEDSFGLPSNKDIFRADVSWHVAKRQLIDFGYFKLDRSGSSVLDEDIQWGDYVYQAGGEVSARFNSEFIYGAWRYLFLDLPEVRLSGSVGVSDIGLEAGLVASGTVTDREGNVVEGTVDEAARVTAPVPMVGLQVDYAPTPRLAFLGFYRTLYVKDVAGIDGSLAETSIRMSWWYARHAGISAGIDTENIDLRSYEKGDTKARFRYQVRAVSVYLTFAL